MPKQCLRDARPAWTLFQVFVAAAFCFFGFAGQVGAETAEQTPTTTTITTQTEATTQTAATPGGPAGDPDDLSPTTAALLDRCFDDYCNLNFDRAETEARAAMAQDPDHPLPALYLQAELAAQIQELMRAHAQVSEPLKRFRLVTKDAEVLAQAREDVRHDARAQLYLGDIFGVAGLVDLSQGDSWAAYRNGRKGFKALRLALKRDPGLADADLGLGEYYYYCSRVSVILRGLLGLPGNMPGGIELMQECSLKASWRSAILARLSLASVLTEQIPNFPEALPYVQDGLARYPDNWSNEQQALEEAKGLGLDRPEARALVLAVAQHWDSGWRPPAYAKVDPAPLRLDLARWYLSHGQTPDAMIQLKALESLGGPLGQQALSLEQGAGEAGGEEGGTGTH